MKVMRPVLILINIVLVLFIWGNSAKPAEVSSEQSGGLAVFLEESLKRYQKKAEDDMTVIVGRLKQNKGKKGDAS